MDKKIRTCAIHLPQFHSIPENDRWWGKGFTEWTNVKKAKPLYKGHYQPHISLNKNYYDLSENQVLCEQAELAKKYGIEGFCFYHYWFNGKKLLEKPLEQMLELGKPDFPFMLCWANENWTRTWDGLDKDVLMKQDYGFEDDEAHFDYLLPFFEDERYIKIDGKPVFLVYRTELFPDINKTADIWRRKSIEAGLPGLYLIRVESFQKNIDPNKLGFDAAMEFQPNWQNLPRKIIFDFFMKLKRRIVRNSNMEVDTKPKIHSYSVFARNQRKKEEKINYKRYASVVPGWDNSPRKKNSSLILNNSTPKEYGNWLKHSLNNFDPFSAEENLFFINAWNEWGEGNHLEPCEKWGYDYLDVTREVLKHV